MGIIRARNQHKKTNTDKKEIQNSILIVVVLGLILGLVFKILDSPSMSFGFSILGYIGSHVSVWIFICSIIALKSKSPRMASLRVVIFLLSMILSYYTYTVVFLNLIPIKYIIFWIIMATLSVIPAYIVWHASIDSRAGKIIKTLPIIAIILEGLKIYVDTKNYYIRANQIENALVSKSNLYYMIVSEVVYIVMVIVILSVEKKKV